MNINDSKYTYAYTNILINKFDIKNADKLKIAEFISVSRKINYYQASKLHPPFIILLS